LDFFASLDTPFVEQVSPDHPKRNILMQDQTDAPRHSNHGMPHMQRFINLAGQAGNADMTLKVHLGA
jgi:hypothetical protein